MYEKYEYVFSLINVHFFRNITYRHSYKYVNKCSTIISIFNYDARKDATKIKNTYI